jgi:hypothetical protein
LQRTEELTQVRQELRRRQELWRMEKADLNSVATDALAQAAEAEATYNSPPRSARSPGVSGGSGSHNAFTFAALSPDVDLDELHSPRLRSPVTGRKKKTREQLEQSVRDLQAVSVTARAQIDDLRSEIATTARELEGRTQQLQSAQQDIEAKQRELDAMTQTVMQRSVQLAESEENNRLLHEAAQQPSSETLSLRQQVRSLEATLDCLTAASAADADQHHNHVPNMSAQSEAALDSVAPRTKTTNAAVAATPAAPTPADRQVVVLQLQLDGQNKQLAEAMKAKEALALQLSVHSDERAAEQARLKDMVAKHAAAVADLGAAQSELASASSSLAATVAAKNAQAVLFDKCDAELKLVRGELERLRASNGRNVEQLKQEHAQSLQQERETIAALRVDLAAAQGALTLAAAKAKSAHQTDDTPLRAMQEQRDAARRELIDTNQRVQELSTQVQTLTVDAAQAVTAFASAAATAASDVVAARAAEQAAVAEKNKAEAAAAAAAAELASAQAAAADAASKTTAAPAPAPMRSGLSALRSGPSALRSSQGNTTGSSSSPAGGGYSADLLRAAIANAEAASALTAPPPVVPPSASGGSRIAALRASLGGFNPAAAAAGRPSPQKPVVATSPAELNDDDATTVAADSEPAALVHITRTRPSSQVSRRVPSNSPSQPQQPQQQQPQQAQQPLEPQQSSSGMMSYSAYLDSDDDD